LFVFYFNEIFIIIDKTKQEIRMENFRQIFDFYAKQHQFIKKNATFEEIQEKFNLMILAEFNKFAIEFKIPLRKEVVTEIFKKNAKNARDMNFDEFMVKSILIISIN